MGQYLLHLFQISREKSLVSKMQQLDIVNKSYVNI